MKAREFDKKFDEGGDISQHLDISKARRPKQEQKMNYDDDKIDECTPALLYLVTHERHVL